MDFDRHYHFAIFHKIRIFSGLIEKFKSLFWDMVKCPNEEQLKGKLEAIRPEYNEACQDLMNKGPKYFYRAYIETWCKYDMINNNICETFNSYIMK